MTDTSNTKVCEAPPQAVNEMEWRALAKTKVSNCKLHAQNHKNNLIPYSKNLNCKVLKRKNVYLHGIH